MKALAVGIALLLISSKVFACSPAPIDERVDFVNGMVGYALTALGVRLDSVRSVQTLYPSIEYEWVYSSGPGDCHDREVIEASFLIEYQNEMGQCQLFTQLRRTSELFRRPPRHHDELLLWSQTCILGPAVSSRENHVSHSVWSSLYR